MLKATFTIKPTKFYNIMKMKISLNTNCIK